VLNVTRISPRQVVARAARGERVTYVDARTEAGWSASPLQITGAIRVALATLDRDAAGIAREGVAVVYGGQDGEHHLAEVATRLRALGCTDVRVLVGGLEAWAGCGLATEGRA
jgi:rhodanese-related sulfurtransferase